MPATLGSNLQRKRAISTERDLAERVDLSQPIGKSPNVRAIALDQQLAHRAFASSVDSCCEPADAGFDLSSRHSPTSNFR